jgi:hypothetical protein
MTRYRISRPRPTRYVVCGGIALAAAITAARLSAHRITVAVRQTTPPIPAGGQAGARAGDLFIVGVFVFLAVLALTCAVAWMTRPRPAVPGGVPAPRKARRAARRAAGGYGYPPPPPYGPGDYQ